MPAAGSSSSMMSTAAGGGQVGVSGTSLAATGRPDIAAGLPDFVHDDIHDHQPTADSATVSSVQAASAGDVGGGSGLSTAVTDSDIFRPMRANRASQARVFPSLPGSNRMLSPYCSFFLLGVFVVRAPLHCSV